VLSARSHAATSPLGSIQRLAPQFTVRSLEGKTLKLDQLRAGGPVLIDFWATWCKPCVAAIPELEQLHQELDTRGLTVIGVSVDGPRNFAKVRPFVAKLGITYAVALDEDGSMQEKFQVRSIPTTVLIGRDGQIVKVVQGYRPGEIKILRASIEPLLLAPADSGAADSTAADSAQRR
jgi:cytochrome c biogenesis protein CcmG, thiol:disulfide interchange protein DsbE